jgi:hypothetical protein
MLEIDSGWEAPVLAMRLLFADKLRDAAGFALLSPRHDQGNQHPS